MPGSSLLVAAGGTGGHLYPALAVANAFRERFADSQVTFVGTERGLEGRIVPGAGFPLELIRAAPLRGGSLVRKLQGVLGLISGMVDASRLIRRLKPAVVMGVGAYVSGTVLLTAALRGIPTLILEPNAEPGLANKWLGPFIDVAACAWKDTTRYFGTKGVVTGNPVRRSVLDVAPLGEQTDEIMRVLLFGGSQGSRILNDTMMESLPLLSSVSDRLRVTHQTGPSDHARVEAAYARHDVRAVVTPYIDAMEEAYAESDLVVSRAGATTCAELAAAGRPALLVPLPLAGGHQRTNADLLANAGAARVIPQDELDAPRLSSELVRLLDAPGERTTMGARAKDLAKAGAADAVVDELARLAAGGQS